MKFPDNYLALKKNEFNNGQFKIIPIRYEDRLLIMNWRNEQIYHLRQKSKLTEEVQNNYFEKIVLKLFKSRKPDQLLFSFLKNKTCVGYGGLVHINWMDKNAEISFIIDPKLENQYFHSHWITFLSMIEKVAFEELGLRKIYTYAFDLRPHLYVAVEASGFKREAELKEHFLHNSKFKSVVIHSKFSNL